MNETINIIDKKLLKWIVETYLNKTWLNYDDLHIDVINKKEPINNLNYWLKILQKLSYYRDELFFDVSICLNIGLNLKEDSSIEDINTIEKAINNFAIDSVPSFYLIGKKILNCFIEDKVKILNDNILETIFTSSYIHSYAENNEVTNMLSIISFTPRDYKVFKSSINKTKYY